MLREFVATTRLKFRLGYFLKKRDQVVNAISIYLVVSSFFLRVIVRFLLGYYKTRFIPIKVKHLSGLVLNYPLFAYLHHSEDLFTHYSNYYFTDYIYFFKKEFVFEEGDVIVDIGAHIGTFSVPLATNNPVTVFAVEPDRINSKYLKANIQINGLDNRVIPVQKAISSAFGQLEFVEGDASTRGTLSKSSFSRIVQSNNRYIVEAIPFDMLVKEYQITNIKLLKIDCEGEEYDIIGKMSKDSFAIIQNMFIEIHECEDKDKNPFELIDYIKSHGFEGQGRALDNGCYEYYFSK